MFRALRLRDYRLYWMGLLISQIGSWIQIVARGWLVLKLSNSPFMLGLVGFLNSLPVMLFALIGGTLADRFNRKKLLLITQSLFMLLALLLAFLILTDQIQVWHVLVAAFIGGCIMAADAPARHAMVLDIVGREYLMNAIALNSAAFNTAGVLGPALAGYLVGALGIGWCFLLNGVSFLAVIFALLVVKVHQQVEEQDGTFWQNITLGIRYIFHHRAILGLVSLVAIGSIWGMPHQMLMPVFARDVLHVGEKGLGYLMSASGFGALLSALCLARLEDYPQKGRLVNFCSLFFSIGLIIFALSPSFSLSLLCLILIGGCRVGQNATVNTLLQTLVPDKLRARVLSVYMMSMAGLAPLGNLQVGFFAQYFGAPFAVGLGGALCCLYALGILIFLPEVRQIRAEQPLPETETPEVPSNLASPNQASSHSQGSK